MTDAVADAQAAAGRVVVNAINLTGRGGRAILADCLGALDRAMPAGWVATAYVAPAVEVAGLRRVTLIPIERRWNSWADRLWFELYGLARREAGRKVSLFLSLQGASARIRAERKLVYCHQNLPLAPLDAATARRHRRFALQRLIYDGLYRFAIPRRDGIIVQQQWTRAAFAARYRHQRVIVARPIAADTVQPHFRNPPTGAGRLRILCPLAAFPNKDVETAIAVAGLLHAAALDFEMTLTIDASEGRYAAALARHAAAIPGINLVGLLTPDALTQAYRSHQLMLFPSRVESWGLPLSEGRAQGIGIIATDHPYAHEAIGDYDGASFFPAGDATAAARLIISYWTQGRPLGHSVAARPPAPYAESWDSLVNMLTGPDFPFPGQNESSGTGSKV